MSRQRLEGEGEGQAGKEAFCVGSAGGGGSCRFCEIIDHGCTRLAFLVVTGVMPGY